MGRSKTSQRKPSAEVAPLSRDKILEVAEALIDEIGPESFSMRKLAARLGVTPMSLYWHIPNKDELIRGVVDKVCERIEIPERGGDGWRARAVTLVTSFRSQLLGHRGTSRLLGSVDLWSPRLLVWANAILELMLEAGFRGADAVRAQSLLVGYAASSLVLVVGQTNPPSDPRELRRRFRKALESLPHESVATLKALGRHNRLDRAHQDEQFEYGLERILDGLEAEAGRLRRSRRASSDGD